MPLQCRHTVALHRLQQSGPYIVFPATSPVHQRIQQDGGSLMGDRIDELKGNVKDTVGDLTDNEEMEREGEAEAASAKAKRETEGAADKVGGKIQEEWGDLTDDSSTEAKGKARQVEGDVKQAG
jgi:uncharacterized protein YjbJ (UPF0337 family)